MGALDREACFGKGNEPLQDLFLAQQTLMPPLHNSDIRHVKACGDAWEMCQGVNTDPDASCTLSAHCFVMRERTRPRKIERPADDGRVVECMGTKSVKPGSLQVHFLHLLVVH
jgi:hypothetical protein